jgi:hypothetical protein
MKTCIFLVYLFLTSVVLAVDVRPRSATTDCLGSSTVPWTNAYIVNLYVTTKVGTGSDVINGALTVGGAATFSNTATVVGNVNVTGAITNSGALRAGSLATTGTVTGTVGGSFGGLVLGYVAKTNGYTPTATDFTMVHTAGFEYTNTLADANTMLGRVFVITSADGTKDIYVNTDGTDTIQGSNKQAVFAETGDSITIQATGANVWTVIQNTGVTFGAIP